MRRRLEDDAAVTRYLRTKKTRVVFSGDQTVFWDGALKLPVNRWIAPAGAKLLVCVHDLDWVSKLKRPEVWPDSSGSHDRDWAILEQINYQGGAFWASAMEMGALFGSEALLSEGALRQTQLPLKLLGRPRLENALRSWRWRGAVLRRSDLIACDAAASRCFPALRHLLRWSAKTTADCLANGALSADILRYLPRLGNGRERLSDAFRATLRQVLPRFAIAEDNIRLSLSSRLFRLEEQRLNAPIFRLARIAFDPDKRAVLTDAYNQAVREGPNHMLQLKHFGQGALPFDLYIEGQGRHKIRLMGRRLVLGSETNGRSRQLPEFSRPVNCWRDFYRAVRSAFPRQKLALAPTAVTLAASLLANGPIVLNRFGSGYIQEEVRHFIDALDRAALMRRSAFHPVIRMRQATYDSLAVLGKEVVLRLPLELAAAFGQCEITAVDFARRWQSASEEGRERLERLIAERKPLKLLEWFAREDPDWRDDLRSLKQVLAYLAEKRGRGEESALQGAREVKARLELKAQAERLRRMRQSAIAASLEKTNHRPYWPWLVMVDPSGRWLKAVVDRSRPHLDHLSAL